MTWRKLSSQFPTALPVFFLLWVASGNEQLEAWTGLSLLSEFAFAGFFVVAIYFQVQLVRVLVGKLKPKRTRIRDITE